MRILLSNDDGIQAHGFSVLENIAAALSEASRADVDR